MGFNQCDELLPVIFKEIVYSKLLEANAGLDAAMNLPEEAKTETIQKLNEVKKILKETYGLIKDFLNEHKDQDHTADIAEIKAIQYQIKRIYRDLKILYEGIQHKNTSITPAAPSHTEHSSQAKNFSSVTQTRSSLYNWLDYPGTFDKQFKPQIWNNSNVGQWPETSAHHFMSAVKK